VICARNAVAPSGGLHSDDCFSAALLTGSMAASQPVEPLGRARPVAPPAPAAPADVAEAPPEAGKARADWPGRSCRKEQEPPALVCTTK